MSTPPCAIAMRRARSPRGGHRVVWRDLVSIPLVGAYAAFFAGQIVMGILSGLWAIWLSDLGGSYTYIGMTMTVFALPQIFLGALAGRLSDRLGRAPLLLAGALLVNVVYASYGFITNLNLIVVVGIVEGMFIIFQRPAAQGLLADASPEEARGRAQGVAEAAGTGAPCRSRSPASLWPSARSCRRRERSCWPAARGARRPRSR